MFNVPALASSIDEYFSAIFHQRDTESQRKGRPTSPGFGSRRDTRTGSRRWIRSLLSAFVVLTLGMGAVQGTFAQEETTRGKIAGIVRDTAGKPIVGARVQIISKLKDTHYDLVTDQNGHYESTWLMESPDYIVRTEARNYKVGFSVVTVKSALCAS